MHLHIIDFEEPDYLAYQPSQMGECDGKVWNMVRATCLSGLDGLPSTELLTYELQVNRVTRDSVMQEVEQRRRLGPRPYA